MIRTNVEEEKPFDDSGRYILRNYDRGQSFTSFLPGQ